MLSVLHTIEIDFIFPPEVVVIIPESLVDLIHIKLALPYMFPAYTADDVMD